MRLAPNLFLKVQIFCEGYKQKREVYGIPEFANFIEIEGNVVQVHTGSPAKELVRLIGLGRLYKVDTMGL